MENFRILLLEDDPVIGFQIKTVMEDMGLSAIVGDGLEDTMRLLQVAEPGVVVLDFHYSVENCKKVAEIMAQLRFRNIRMLLVTGVLWEEACLGPWSDELFQVLFKPYTVVQFRAKLTQLLYPRPKATDRQF